MVNGFAAGVESFVVVPLLLCKTRDAVGPHVEVSTVSVVGWSVQVRTSTSRTSGAAHLPMIIQPDDGAHTWLLPISETSLCRKAELRSPELSATLRAVIPCRHKAGWS